MFEFFFTIIDFFSPYANSFEKQVDKYLSRLSDKSSTYETEKQIIKLMKQNLVVLQLWTERRYKGYRYLHKRKRRELYQNVEAIKKDFLKFCEDNPFDINEIYAEIKRHGISPHRFQGLEDKLQYLACIMRYFAPEEGKFVYRESSNFGGLLCDPAHDKLIGDCNQIVTLYIYFYGLKYDLKDLRIKTYPGHVALHFNGIDIEATNGQFASYQEKGQKVLPIHEIMSVNLLDTTDSYFKTHQLHPKAILESAKLAFLISSNRDIVENNLKAAYSQIINHLTKNNKFDQALTYAQQSNNSDLIHLVGHNAAVHYLQKNEFTTARKFAIHSDKSPDLQKSIDHNEGVAYLNKGDYQKALTIFKKLHDAELVKQCYLGLYSELQKKLRHVKTIADLKKQKSTLLKLQDYAQKSGDYKLVQHVKDMLDQIR